MLQYLFQNEQWSVLFAYPTKFAVQSSKFRKKKFKVLESAKKLSLQKPKIMKPTKPTWSRDHDLKP